MKGTLTSFSNGMDWTALRRCFRVSPLAEERLKIQWFVDNFDGEDEEPWVKDIVELAKVISEEMH